MHGPANMTAQSLYQEGKLREAAEAASAALRDDPANERLRSFLFELLCFAGEFDRADKHLELLAGKTKDRQLGALHLRAALATARTREEMFAAGEAPPPPPARPLSGACNGKPFTSLTDADPRIGARLEVFASGNYFFVPFEHVAELSIEPPHRLRDLLWCPARLTCGPHFGGGQELGDVLLPALAPLTWQHPEDPVRLGRLSVWESDGSSELLFGQKLLLIDNEEVPLLEVRHLTIESPDAAS
ncbi:MAG: tetratricopeptide repeat protein [Bryobacter sp.]|nr:tetratricopeptide repeat protein [Bryobacter sp.]